ncbi:tetratricopeptide repeat protein [Enhygromyxa salina]|uniref:Tetratricopeptide repeat protein n=1 Tax=Enhygromyxa salina TaxID=215803 RepID=A0A2S9YFA5_9BACT|nr:tetratricopeptide repeat protein [Enhygromyxa salina]PRQ03790.1 Tetratricopeptide repeat protein [Enhygromyxa salina]
MIPVTPLLSALSSITLSLSLALGSTVALAAPAATPAPEQDAPTEEEERKSEAEELSDQAIVKFQAKDYDGAVALFEQAYAVDPQPNFLFNIGRVHEEAGNLDKAVEYYAKFVKQPGVDLTSRETALDRLKVLRAILQETTEKPPETKPDTEVEPIEPPPPQPDPVDEDAKRKRKVLRAAGFGLTGVGAAAMIGGAVVGGLAQGDFNKAGEAESPGDNQPLLDSAKTKALTADILLGVGGAVLLTGVILVAVGFSKPKQSSRVALTPSFGPRGGGGVLRVRF